MNTHEIEFKVPMQMGADKYKIGDKEEFETPVCRELVRTGKAKWVGGDPDAAGDPPPAAGVNRGKVEGAQTRAG